MPTWEEFLDSPEPGPALAGPDLDVNATRRSMGVPAPADKPMQGDFISRNQQELPIDLDIESSSEFKRSLLRRNQKDQLDFLKEQPGVLNVRFADDGSPLVTAYDSEKKRPFEFRPLGSGANVLNKAQVALPEVAGSLFGMIAGKKIPTNSRFLKFASEMIGAGVGQEAGGAAQDIAVSSSPLGEILSERAGRIPQSTAINAAAGAVGAGIAKVGGRILSPFGGPGGEIEQGTAEAIAHFRDKFGIDYPLTTGEKINSTIFKRGEATMSRQPGASANFDKIQRQKVEALRQIQAKMLSSKVDPADMGMLGALEEDVGQEAINTLRQSVHPLQRAQEAARSNAATAASDAIMDELAGATGAARQLYPEAVGARMRSGAFAKRDAFEAESGNLYGKAYALEGGRQKIIQPPNLVGDARALLKEQPAAEVTVTKPTGLVDQWGKPITHDVTGQEILREFVPEGIMPMLGKLADLKGAKFSLQDLVKMRTEVRNNIKRGEAVPGVNTHYLGEIEDLLTKSINEGAGALPTPDLRNAWKAANDHYATGVRQFKDKNVARFFRDNETGSFIQDEDLVRNIGPSEYSAYKNFFGETSPEFSQLKRALIDGLLPGEGLIDAKAFLGNMKTFLEKNRSVAEDILGPNVRNRLQSIGGKLEAIQAGEVVNKDDLLRVLLNNRNTSAPMLSHSTLLTKIDDLVKAERKVSETYRSQILKDIGDGKLGQNFDATEFISRMWNKASPAEIKAIKDQLAGHPELLEKLERKAAERVFFEAQGAGRGQGARVGSGAPFHKPTSSSIENVFGNEQNKARLKELLGDDRLKDFEQLAKMLKGGELSESGFAGAGGFSAQMQLHNMAKGGVLGYMADWAKQKVMATIYFSTPVRKLIANQVGRSPEAQANVMRAAVLSQPFREAIEEDMGDQSGNFIDKVLDSIDLYQTQGAPGKKAVSQQSWTDFLNEDAQKAKRPKVFPVR